MLQMLVKLLSGLLASGSFDALHLALRYHKGKVRNDGTPDWRKQFDDGGRDQPSVQWFDLDIGSWGEEVVLGEQMSGLTESRFEMEQLCL